MRNSRSDVVAAALRVLDEQGLEGCSMRRVAAELGVQPSALYHHVANKQSLLALMADTIVRPVAGDTARELCVSLRHALLRVRDGAEVVATAAAFRLGASRLERRLAGWVGADGASTLMLYTFGHTLTTQTREQAAAFGALLADDAASAGTAGAAGRAGGRSGVDAAAANASFERGLEIILRGLDAGRAAERPQAE